MPYEFEMRSLKNPCLPTEENSIYKELWNQKSTSAQTPTETAHTASLPPSVNEVTKIEGLANSASKASSSSTVRFEPHSPRNELLPPVLVAGTLMAGMHYAVDQWDKELAANSNPGGIAKFWKPFSGSVHADALAPAAENYELAVASRISARNLLQQQRLALKDVTPGLHSVREAIEESLKREPTSELFKKQSQLFSKAPNLTPTNLKASVGEATEFIKGTKLFSAETEAGKAILKYAESAAAHAEAKCATFAAEAELEFAKCELNSVRSGLAATLEKSALEVAAKGFGKGLLFAGGVIGMGKLMDASMGKNPDSNPATLLVDGIAIPTLLSAGGRLSYPIALGLFLGMHLSKSKTQSSNATRNF